MQKYYTVSCFSHQIRKNRGQLEQFYNEANHDAIIPPDIWEEVQRQLVLRRFERPKKQKIEQKAVVEYVKSGNFKGFEVIKPKCSRKEIELYLQIIENEE